MGTKAVKTQKKLYYSFNDYLQGQYGERVHKLSLNAGFSCPNKDGTLGISGCIFCNEQGFSHFGGRHIPIEEQISTSLHFAKKRFKAQKFIAYFQTGSNTYASNEKLLQAYSVIRKFPDIIGLFISTRPDCIDGEKLDLIQGFTYDYEVWIEYGLQSIHEKTLAFINRKHTYQDFLRAIDMTSKTNIKTAAHVILGLPGETKDEMVKTAAEISRLPLSGVKLHAFHILRNTKCENLFSQGKIRVLKLQEYVQYAADFLENLNPKFVILRLVSDANEEFLMAPLWVNQKQEAIRMIEKELSDRNSFQGKIYEPR